MNSPEWLILIPILISLGIYQKSLQLWRPLRCLSLIFLVGYLVHPRINLVGKGIDLWLLVDRSQSAADSLPASFNEWDKILQKTKSKNDRIFYIDYADIAIIRSDNNTEKFSGNGLYTRTKLAIQLALTSLQPNRTSRLLVLTDGYSTNPVLDAAEQLLSKNVAMDYRLVSDENAVDFRIDKIVVPEKTQLSEPYIIEIVVSGNIDQTLPIEIFRDNESISTTKVEIIDGRGVLRLTDRIHVPGSHKYSVQILAQNDTKPGNNRGENWLEVVSGPRILLLTGYTRDPVAAVLKQQGFELEVINNFSRLNVGKLSGVKALILNNVPAYQLPESFLAAIPFYIQHQGGGLMMVGGKYSFGSGGYFGSAIDELLPVSMELKHEHRKLMVAMAIVMDRSGSMAAHVTTDSGVVTKMDLANEGAARSVELLGANDVISVFAVDSQAHEIVPLTQVGPNMNSISNTIRGINSAGGGIYVFTGLINAWSKLQKATIGQRHIILFADAADAEEPGNYKDLISEIVRENGTISVIGLGTEDDKDAEFLKDIAERGNGRIFFNSDPVELPALFAQETVAIVRSAFLEDPVQITPNQLWLGLAARSINWLDTIDGYNLSYAREEANVAISSADEYNAPLLAYWQRGIGRVAAVSFPLGGEYSNRIRSWNRYGDFIQTLSRWLMGDELPEGIGLKAKLDGSTLSLDLKYDDAWHDKMNKINPEIFMSEGKSGKINTLIWERLKPGHFQSTTQLESGQWVRGAVQLGNTALTFGPIVAGTNPEWSFDKSRIKELKHLSNLSGGTERINLSDIWSVPQEKAQRDISNWFLVCFLCLFLLETLVTRIGWQLPILNIRTLFAKVSLKNQSLQPQKISKKQPEKKVKEPEKVVEDKITQTEPDKPTTDQRRDRFQKAKR